MTTVPSGLRMQEIDRLAPSTHDALRRAQQEATRLQTGEVSPELLLLAVILQGHDGVGKVLSQLGINLQLLRAQATEIFTVPWDAEAEKPLNDGLSLSGEAQTCLEWSISFATDRRAPLVLPEHLLLGALRHPRTQPLLALFLPAEGVLPAPVIEAAGQDYTSSIDQLIHSRVREQSMVYSSKGRSPQLLRGFERPTRLFRDISGEDDAKQALQEAVDFLRKPRMARRQEKNYLCGLVLVGGPRRNRTQLVQAVSGEAVVPLLTLSLAALVRMLSDIARGSMELEDFDLAEEERTLLATEEVVQRGRRMIGATFERARKAAPCVLLLDDLDAIDQLSTQEERQQWLNQVLEEMDRRDPHPSMVVIAATEHPDSFAHALLHPARFEQCIVLEDSAFIQTRPCPSCRRTAQRGWKHCMYCGTVLAKVCPHCHVLLPELEGVHFCFECGSRLEEFVSHPEK
jgi:SpoVK/Ycf46/Vps4 family AAA+-type ATPase